MKERATCACIVPTPYLVESLVPAPGRYLSPAVTICRVGSFENDPRPRQQAPPEWARWADPEEVKAADSRLDADARWAQKVGVSQFYIQEQVAKLRELCSRNSFQCPINLAAYKVHAWCLFFCLRTP